MSKVTPDLQWLTRERRSDVIQAALKSKKRDSIIVSILLSTGLLDSELISLRVEDIQDRDGRLWILVKSHKGIRRRLVPLHKGFGKDFQEYLYQECAAAAWVFHNQNGEPLTEDDVQRIVAAIGKQAGITELSPGILRNTFCHDLAEAGVRPEVVAALIGVKVKPHASIKNT